MVSGKLMSIARQKWPASSLKNSDSSFSFKNMEFCYFIVNCIAFSDLSRIVCLLGPYLYRLELKVYGYKGKGCLYNLALET